MGPRQVRTRGKRRPRWLRNYPHLPSYDRCPCCVLLGRASTQPFRYLRQAARGGQDL